MPRNDANVKSLAEVLVIDWDKQVNSDGVELDGSPNPLIIHQILKEIVSQDGKITF